MDPVIELLTALVWIAKLSLTSKSKKRIFFPYEELTFHSDFFFIYKKVLSHAWGYCDFIKT